MAKESSSSITEFQEKLISWFELHGRTFPWRLDNLTHYELVIAETLLQRTKAETVAKFFKGFIKQYPNWEALASAEIATLENNLKPIGLYRQRAKRIQHLAIEMKKRNGTFPEDRTELESIPFLGQYIANAIELLIFNKPSPLIDVNMVRLLERYYRKRKMADIRYDTELQALAYKISNTCKSKNVNWAILDFSATICKSRKPLCNQCIFSAKCSFFKLNRLALKVTTQS